MIKQRIQHKPPTITQAKTRRGARVEIKQYHSSRHVYMRTYCLIHNTPSRWARATQAEIAETIA